MKIEAYEAVVEELERGGNPVPILTRAESAALTGEHLAKEAWRTPEERRAARSLLARLGRVRWGIDAKRPANR